MKESLNVTDLEQIKALADRFRLQILEKLESPKTVKQLADQLGEVPAKIHYHVKELERIGLLELVATKENGGILEKYYQVVAKHIYIKKDLLTDSTAEIVKSEVLENYNHFFQEALAIMKENFKNQEEKASLSMRTVKLTKEQYLKVTNLLDEIIDQMPKEDGGEEYRILMTLYPTKKEALLSE